MNNDQVGVQVTDISIENELAIYGKITNFEGLKQATKVIYQEQHSIKPKEAGNLKGSIRVRKEVIDGIEDYSLTTKVNQGGNLLDCNKEFTCKIDREYFDAFKSIAGSGMLKTRYVFEAKKITLGDLDIETDGTKFEVDVFNDAVGNPYSWCKIDIELDSVAKKIYSKLGEDKQVKLKILASKLPFNPIDVFTNKTADLTQKQILDHLYKYVFTIQK